MERTSRFILSDAETIKNMAENGYALATEKEFQGRRRKPAYKQARRSGWTAAAGLHFL
ncbi:MAG: hypothetical protein LUB63_01540 [Oscillospiraceae bacterium]|nr:hypothetical protein [Oscillospiraceae bacterium]